MNLPSTAADGHSGKSSRGRELGVHSGDSELLTGRVAGGSGERLLLSAAAAVPVGTSVLVLARLDGAFFGGMCVCC